MFISLIKRCNVSPLLLSKTIPLCSLVPMVHRNQVPLHRHTLLWTFFQLLALTGNWLSQRIAIMKEMLLKEKFLRFLLERNPLWFGLHTCCTTESYCVKVTHESLVTKSNPRISLFLTWLLYSAWKCCLLSFKFGKFWYSHLLVLHNSNCPSSSLSSTFCVSSSLSPFC